MRDEWLPQVGRGCMVIYEAWNKKQSMEQMGRQAGQQIGREPSEQSEQKSRSVRSGRNGQSKSLNCREPGPEWTEQIVGQLVWNGQSKS